MKLPFTFLFFLPACFSFCQPAGDTDTILEKFTRSVAPRWDYVLKNDTLSIYARDTMWIDFYNSAGVPHDDPGRKKYTESYLKQHGRKTRATLVFALEKKWSPEQVKKTTEENVKIYEAAEELKKKYRIDHLKPSYRYEEEIFREATDDEKKRIEAYRAEKEKLLQTAKPVPYYHTEQYSLFIVSRNWEGSSSYMIPVIWPPSAEQEINTLEKLISEILYRQP